MSRPLLLDLFCGAGGASAGYQRAGFDVVGIDNIPQPNYPFSFICGDAIDYVERCWHLFDAIHASPPCQVWSKMTACRPGLREEYEALIKDTRVHLASTGLPYIIENVPGAPLIDPIELCGFMFGRELYRHRWFESNIALSVPQHPEHAIPGSKAGHWRPGTVISVAGHCAPMWKARKEMDIAWTTRDELGEAIPPYFAEYVGRQIIKEVT